MITENVNIYSCEYCGLQSMEEKKIKLHEPRCEKKPNQKYAYLVYYVDTAGNFHSFTRLYSDMVSATDFKKKMDSNNAGASSQYKIKQLMIEPEE